MIDISYLKNHIYDVVGAIHEVHKENDIIVECKAVVELTNIHRSQLFNYLRLTKFPCGILVNFAPRFATIERYFYDESLGEVLTVEGRLVRHL